MRQRFALAAEDVLRDNGGAELVLADVAARLGMSQSNSYRYFPDRQALISLLADTWFATVEAEVAAAVSEQDGPEAQVVQWVLATMRAKCARHDADPVLFRAYLKLAVNEPDAIARHLARLRDMVRPALAKLTSAAEAEPALAVLEDATILFRNPYLISENRAALSEARAEQVTRAIVRSLGAPTGCPP
jgi:AcrR family transcriptional regulator